MKDRICAVCGTKFEAKTERSKYCSDYCKNRSRYPRSQALYSEESEAARLAAVNLYDSDMTTEEIARTIGKSKTFVYLAWHSSGLPKRLTHFQKEVAELRKQGMCCVEIADRLKKQNRTIYNVCNTIGMPFTEDEIKRSVELGKTKAVIVQYGSEFERKQKQIDFIAEHYPGWEYVSGFVSSDGYVELRCKKCNHVIKKSAVAIRHINAPLFCAVCKEHQRQEEIAKRKEERQKAKELAFWGQPFHQMNFNMCSCKECGTYYIGFKDGFCSEECKRKYINRKHDKRIDKAPIVDKSITLKLLYKRDSGKCWLCGRDCNYNDHVYKNGKFVAGREYPSIDHVQPLAKGGSHTWNNVRLAHHYCNTLKRDRVV